MQIFFNQGTAPTVERPLEGLTKPGGPTGIDPAERPGDSEFAGLLAQVESSPAESSQTNELTSDSLREVAEIEPNALLQGPDSASKPQLGLNVDAGLAAVWMNLGVSPVLDAVALSATAPAPASVSDISVEASVDSVLPLTVATKSAKSQQPLPLQPAFPIEPGSPATAVGVAVKQLVAGDQVVSGEAEAPKFAAKSSETVGSTAFATESSVDVLPSGLTQSDLAGDVATSKPVVQELADTLTFLDSMTVESASAKSAQLIARPVEAKVAEQVVAYQVSQLMPEARVEEKMISASPSPSSAPVAVAVPTAAITQPTQVAQAAVTSASAVTNQAVETRQSVAVKRVAKDSSHANQSSVLNADEPAPILGEGQPSVGVRSTDQQSTGGSAFGEQTQDEQAFGTENSFTKSESAPVTSQPQANPQIQATTGKVTAEPVVGATTAKVDAETRQRLVKEVSQQIDSLLANSVRNEVVMRLNPEHLGTITINLRREMAGFTAELSASEAPVREALQQSRPDLVQHFQQKGIGELKVTVSQEASQSFSSSQQQDSGSQTFSQMDQRQQQREHLASSFLRSNALEGVAKSATNPQSFNRFQQQGVDLTI